MDSNDAACRRCRPCDVVELACHGRLQHERGIACSRDEAVNTTILCLKEGNGAGIRECRVEGVDDVCGVDGSDK